MMIVVFREYHFLVPFLEKEAPESWNGRYEGCHTTLSVTVNEINLISKWFAMIVYSCSAEN